ncbi:MAG: GNAT family N-acetyltransferase [Candidatus Eremiobacteraeota bacterium]|nr:GNAT family N-acetyltransferase [Candidatus Eremiobacteraeota bacterium]
MTFQFRKASQQDADAIAVLFRRTREHSMPYLPPLHSIGDDKSYFNNIVLAQDIVWVAESGGDILGFCAFRDQWLDHLYVDPKHQRLGIGSALLGIVTKQNRVLNLWVFQRNTAAIHFYERHRFILIRKTDGHENEEKEPDALYRRGSP